MSDLKANLPKYALWAALAPTRGDKTTSPISMLKAVITMGEA